MLYKLFVPKQAVGASLVYFDFWNPGSQGVDVQLLSVLPVVSGEVAVTGTLAVDLFLTRTTAIGTGGTAATIEGTSLTAATFVAVDSSQPLRAASMSARLTPSGGATAGAVLAFRSVFTEETADAAYTPVPDMVGSPILVRGGSGIRVVQGSVASVGNIAFDILLSVTER